MVTDSLKITQNDDGSFMMDWDKEDPNWSFLNRLTSKEIQIIVLQAVQDRLKDLNTKSSHYDS
jgi:hypothetical protein